MMDIFKVTALDFNNPWWLLPLVVWDLVWKGLGLWKAAKNNHRKWFIAMLLVNTVGILPIVYLLLQRKGSSAYIKFFQKKKKVSV